MKFKVEPFFYALLALLMAHMVIRYSGASHPSMMGFLMDLAYDGSLTNDLCIENSYFSNVSLVYSLVDWLNIDLHNDYIGFAVYIVTSLVGLVFAYLIVRRFFGAASPEVAAAILLVTVFLDNKFLWSTHAGLFYMWNGTPSLWGHALGFVALFFILNRQHVATALLLTLLFAVAPKQAWFPAIVAGLMALSEPGERKAWVAMYLVPFAYVVWKYLSTTPVGTPEELAYVGQWGYIDSVGEQGFLNQPLPSLIIFGMSLVAYPFLIRVNGNATTRRFLWITYGATIFVTALGAMYFAFAYKWYASPLLFQLGWLRATKVFQFTFIVLACVWLFSAPGLSRWHRVSGLLALMVLRVDTLAYSVAAAVVASGIAGSWLSRHLTGSGGGASKFLTALEGGVARISPAMWIFVFSALLLAIQAPRSSPWASFNAPALEAVNKWTFKEKYEPGEWEALRALRARDDFILISAVRSNGGAAISQWANLIAHKSQFACGVSALLQAPKALREMERRIAIQGRLDKSLRSGTRVEPDVLRALAISGVRILVPGDARELFPPALASERVGDMVLFDLAAIR